LLLQVEQLVASFNDPDLKTVGTRAPLPNSSGCTDVMRFRSAA
jgi:hypothetical protein